MVNMTTIRVEVSTTEQKSIQWPDSPSDVSLDAKPGGGLVLTAVYDSDATTTASRTVRVETIDGGEQFGDVDAFVYTSHEGPTYAAIIE